MHILLSFFEYLLQNQQEILKHIIEHIRLTVLSVSISILIGIPLGIIISYIKCLKKPVLGFSNLTQAIPSLALLGFLVPFLGIGATPAIFMVVVYSLLPIIKNTTTGLDSIPEETIEAATGLGMTRLQILYKIKLPQALPIVMAGVRISAVTSVGLVTIAALIGAGGLGYLVYSGIRTVNSFQILAGAIPACLLALSMDFLASLVEKSVTPLSFTDKVKTADKKSIKMHNIKKKITLIITSVLLLSIFFSNIIVFPTSEKVIVIGAKDFTEQDILGNIYSELITQNTDIKVEYKSELGTQVLFTAMQSGEIDLYIEYTGTVYGSILGYSERKSPEEIYDISVNELDSNYNLTMLKPLGFNNTFTLAVTKETAEKYNLATFSDLSKVSSQLKLGAVFEILNRSDGIPNLTKEYNMNFKEITAIDGTPRYTALIKNDIQVTDAFSTDGMLVEYDLVVLEDDKNFFPPYYAAPIIRPEVLEKYPELIPVINKLNGLFDDDTMRDLNYRVDVLKENPKDVAIDFLKKNNLI